METKSLVGDVASRWHKQKRETCAVTELSTTPWRSRRRDATKNKETVEEAEGDERYPRKRVRSDILAPIFETHDHETLGCNMMMIIMSSFLLGTRSFVTF